MPLDRKIGAYYFCPVCLFVCQSVVIGYCKHGYFRWGKISRKCWQDISHRGNLHETTPISFINAYGFYFRLGVIFCEEDKSAKHLKITPTQKFSRLR